MIDKATPRWAASAARPAAPSLHLIRLAHPTDFEGWRRAARSLRAGDIAPPQVRWTIDGGDLFADGEPAPAAGPRFNVPRAFVDLALDVIHHRAPERLDLLYRLLWRLADEPDLLKIPTDLDVVQAEQLRRQVKTAVHKMHAFVRFRQVEGEDETYVAWFEPPHPVVELAAPHFVERFANMRFSILTPDRCAHWDGEALTFTPGARAEDAPSGDALEDHWRTYYASIFNPARLKVGAMKKEMPQRYWRNLPEARLIPDLIQQASARTEAMVEAVPTAPSKRTQKAIAQASRDAPYDGSFVPASVDEVWPAVQACRRCDLWRNATQGVAGVGPAAARLMLVGEQPGDQEDLQGRPFIGPAGQLLDRALAEAGVDRGQLYVTNAVKHFKFEPRGKRRLHKTPDTGEIRACRWWLEHELKLVRPKVVVAMGATAAGSVFGRAMPILKTRGQPLPLESGATAFVTVHPSYLLRLPDAEAKEAGFRAFVADLSAAAEHAGAD
ncbi:MAG TPA: UdgX family uracil-DNA binding protein [Caulobacteraceae bacterium]